MQARNRWLLFLYPFFVVTSEQEIRPGAGHTLKQEGDIMAKKEGLRSAYGYIRVSTHEQEELSPDSQERLLRDYARSNNLFLEHIYTDAGISGRKADKRPAFQEMIARAKSKEHPVDVLLVWKFSRFARNQEESIVYKSLLKKAGVDVVSVSEPLVEGPFGSLIERIIEWMDEYYSIRLSGEVKRGMTEKAMQGGYMARAPLGYINFNRTLKIVPEEASIVRLIFRKFRELRSFVGVARFLNDAGIRTKRGGLWEARMVKYIMQNPVYKGYARWNVGKNNLRGPSASSPDMILVRGDFEPIIDEEEFDWTQEEIARMYRKPKSRPAASYGHWLGNLVKCSSCGSSLTYSPATKGFQCISYGKGKCRVSHYISVNNLEKVILETLESSIQGGEIEYREELPAAQEENEELSFLQLSLEKLEDKEKRIRAAYQNGIDSLEEYRQNKNMIAAERERLNRQIKKLTENLAPAPAAGHSQEMRRRIHGVVDILRSDASKETKSQAIRSICDKIVFDRAACKVRIYCVYRAL